MRDKYKDDGMTVGVVGVVNLALDQPLLVVAVYRSYDCRWFSFK